MNTRVLLAFVGITAIALSGCAASTPVATQSPAAPTSATPAPDPVAESVIVGGLSFSIEYSLGDPAVFEYSSDPAMAIDALSDAFGEEPTVAEVPEANCSTAFTQTSWDGFEVRTDSDALPPKQQFSIVVVDSAPLAVAASDGSILGTDNTDVLAATDENLKSDSGQSATTSFDVQDLAASGLLYDENGPVLGPNGELAWGGHTLSRSGVVTTIAAPVYFGDC